MIEDKDLKLKVASNSEEAKWSEMLDRIEKDILSNKMANEINEKVIELCRKKLREFGK